MRCIVENFELDQETLRRLQLVQLEIFKKIDEVCKKHEIPYSLYGGTLLGAVRHNGFIPWDDDLDIAMTRENYDKFRDAWNNENIEGYFFQEYENDPGFTRTFGKVRKNGTIFMGHDEVDKEYHHGIFVDIFPFDKVKDTAWSRMWHKVIGCLYLLYSRRYAPTKNGKFMERISKFLLAVTPKKWYPGICKRCKKYVTKEVKTDNFYYITYSSFRTIRWRLGKELFEGYTEMQFEDMKAISFQQYDMYLKNIYGDYMQLPPEEKRKGSHIIVELNF